MPVLEAVRVEAAPMTPDVQVAQQQRTQEMAQAQPQQTSEQQRRTHRVRTAVVAGLMAIGLAGGGVIVACGDSGGGGDSSWR